MGVVYTLAINNFSKLSEPLNKLSLVGLKDYLKDMNHTKSARILCLDECESCDILVDGEKTKTVDNFLDKSVKTYRYEFSYGYVEKEQAVFFNSEDVQEDVCFSFAVDKNGVGEQVLVEFREKVYDFSNYFQKPKVYASVEEASDAKEELRQEVMQ